MLFLILGSIDVEPIWGPPHRARATQRLRGVPCVGGGGQRKFSGCAWMHWRPHIMYYIMRRTPPEFVSCVTSIFH